MRRGRATPVSQHLRQQLRAVFRLFEEEFSECQMSPLLYGSVRYGDAGTKSDIDLLYLYAGEDSSPTYKVRTELIGRVEEAIDDRFHTQHQVKDSEQSGETMLYIPAIQAILTDIINGETDQVADYSISESNASASNVFYGYHLLLESIPLCADLGEVSAEVEDVQNQVQRAIQADPFFEFIMAYKLLGSLEKRISHLDRK